MYTVSDCDTIYYKGDDLALAKELAEKYNADIFDTEGDIV